MINRDETPTEPAAARPARRGLAPETLVGSVAVLLAVTVVQRSVGLVRGLLFCSWLDARSLGEWEMAYGFLLLAAPLAVLGLPGSFGRYLVRYREQGRLAMFLRRTSAWSFGLAAVFVAGIVLFREQMARLVFDTPSATGLMVLVAATLFAVITHHFAEAVFAGLRLFRVVSAMHFCQSMAFAVFALGLMTVRPPDASAVVIAYGAACVLSIGTVGLAAGLRLREPGRNAAPTPHSEFWLPLMRFAFWVWVSNLLSNLFAVIDRYMILHFGNLSPEAALSVIGDYHAANIIPLLMVSVANLLVGALTPHLSHAWELGARDKVSDLLNLALKLTAFGMLALGSVVLLICPWLFEVAFPHKYAGGLAVMPWAVATCVWVGLLTVAQAYAWCAEQSRRCAAPLALGLLLNVLLNLMMVPAYGLWGAVVATAVATLLGLAAQLWVNRMLGMRLHLGTLLLSLAPLALGWGWLAGLAATVTAAFAFRLLLTDHEIKLGERMAARLFRRVAEGSPSTVQQTALT